MAQLYSLDQEKVVLSGVLRHPIILADIRTNESDFSETNRDVFSAIRVAAASGGEFSKHLVIDRLNSIGFKVGGTLDPGIYINSLDLMGVDAKAAIGMAKKLRQTTVRRQAHMMGQRIAKATEKDEGKKANEIVGEVTGIFNEQVNLIDGTGEDEPIKLFGTIKNVLRHKTAYTSGSIIPPFKVFADLYGAWDPGTMTVIASRMKVGKSTFWLSTMSQLCEADVNDELRVLVLDTELTAEENQFRALSSLSEVKEYYIRHRKYLLYPEMKAKVEAAADVLEPYGDRIDHIYVGGKSLEEQLSIARRWAYKTLKAGKKGMIILDYFKLNSSSDFKSKNSLFLTIGEKADAFKNLSKELKIPTICFVQTNRENEETKAGGRLQNSAVIGGSDMIAQFGSNIYLLERLYPEEKMALCPDPTFNFTHRLTALETRQLGPDEMGLNRLVKYTDDKNKTRWCNNYLLFEFSSFRVTEKGTFYDLMERMRITGAKVQPVNENQGPLL